MRSDRPFDLNGHKNRPFSVIFSEYYPFEGIKHIKLNKMFYFRSFLPGYGPFEGIKNIKLNKLLYVTHSTLSDKHDKLHYIVIEPIDFK